jgi:hypothetical protein
VCAAALAVTANSVLVSKPDGAGLSNRAPAFDYLPMPPVSL